MIKKIFIIGAVCFLVLPYQSVLGASYNIQVLEEKQTYEEIISPDIVNMINQIDEEILFYYLEKFVSFGFKKTGSENADQAAHWIKSEFEEIGLYTYFDQWKFPRCKDKNVIAIHNGTDETSDATILICAHYDTYNGSPGAIDDGTGIAAMLSIANITKEISFNHTIRFVATGAEEGFAFGSFADAKKAYWNDENIIAVLNIDTIGFDKSSEKSNIVELVGRVRSYWLADFIKEISNKYESEFYVMPRYCGGNYPTDQESYHVYGYDGLMFVQPNIDEYNFKIVHTPNDTIDKVNFSYLENVTKLILATACELAIKPIDVQVRITSPLEGCIYIRNIPIKLPCYNIMPIFTRLRAITYIIGKTTVKINITTKEKINGVYFGLDGFLRHIDREPPYEYRIGKGDYRLFFRAKGHYILSVLVTTNTGKVAYDEMDIFILRLI